MSLIVLYGDELAADQRCVLRFPHAYGQTYNERKLHIAKDKTFAFASVGRTLTEKEQNILEQILVQSFKESEGDQAIVELTHQDWFDDRLNVTFLVMTKLSNYYSFLVGSDEARSGGYPAETKDRTEHAIFQFDSSFPAGHGTGFQVASMALREGVPMNELMPIVADVEFSVGPEFDYVHRRTLKRMS